MIEQPGVERLGRLQAAGLEVGDGSPRERQGSVAVVGDHEELGQQRVVVGGHAPALLDARVDPQAGAADGSRQRVNRPGTGRKARQGPRR